MVTFYTRLSFILHILNSPEWTWPEDLNSMLFILTHCWGSGADRTEHVLFRTEPNNADPLHFTLTLRTYPSFDPLGEEGGGLWLPIISLTMSWMQKKTSVEGKLPGREFGNSTVSKVRIYKQWLNPGVPMAPVCEVWGCPTEDEHCTGVSPDQWGRSRRQRTMDNAWYRPIGELRSTIAAAHTQPVCYNKIRSKVDWRGKTIQNRRKGYDWQLFARSLNQTRVMTSRLSPCGWLPWRCE